MRHVAVAVALLRHHEEAPAIERRIDRSVRRQLVVPVGFRIVARAVGIARKDRDIAAAIGVIAVGARGLRQARTKKSSAKKAKTIRMEGPPYPATTHLGTERPSRQPKSWLWPRPSPR